jgi:hypothetical protein
MPTTRQSRIAEFVRGYFVWLETAGVRAALLHGGEDGFEGEISDVDHVVESAAFTRIASLIHQYCSASGWLLCQVLRHEDTAAFCVCSALDDPSCVVALDACSDYQRNGRVFLSAEDLLDNRQAPVGGGFRLSPRMELRYRFIKAAAKAKQPRSVVPGMLAMGKDSREGFSEWLNDAWKVRLIDWTPSAMVTAMEELSKHCGPQSASFRLSQIPRLARRIMHPDGLLVLLATRDEERVQALTDVFSGLYFRRHKSVSRSSFCERLDLIRSNLVISSSTGNGFSAGLDHDCVLLLPDSLSLTELNHRIAAHLHQRCLNREIKPKKLRDTLTVST